MLFPQDPGYNSTDKDVQAVMESVYRQAITLNLSYWAEADMDTRFRAGDQQLWNDLYGNIPAMRRRNFNFNRIRRVCNMISGYQRQHQKSIICTPREPEDQQTADQFTKLFFWADNHAGMRETVSQCFDACVTTGLTLGHLWWDYRQDPINGRPKFDVLYYNDFLIDPYFRKQDLSDCNYIWRRNWLSRDDLLSLYPDQHDTIASISPQGYNRDGKFQYQPEAYNFGTQKLIIYDEYFYKTYRKAKLLVDNQSGNTLEWQGSDQDLRLFLFQFPHISVMETSIPTTKVACLGNGKLLYDGKLPTGDSYPFVPFYCYYEPQMVNYAFRIQGVVRNLRDAQYLYNRRKIIELDMLESTVTTGWKFKEDALIDPKSIYLTGQGRGIALKKDAQMTDVEQIQPPQVPPSMIELSRALGDEIQQISGVNEELLGSADDDKAGILSMLRQGAGLITLQPIFDQLDHSVKMLGKVLMEAMQYNLTPGFVQRIINEEPSMQFYDRFFGSFDCQVEEGANTSTQKQLNFSQLLHLRELGIPIPVSELIKSSTLQNKNDLIQAIESEQQQQAQLQQQQAQIEMMRNQASSEMMQSKAMLDQAATQEKYAQAEANVARGTLDEVRALKELDQMDLQTIEHWLNLTDRVKQELDQQIGVTNAR